MEGESTGIGVRNTGKTKTLREALFRNGALLEGRHLISAVFSARLVPRNKQKVNLPVSRPRLRAAIIKRENVWGLS